MEIKLSNFACHSPEPNINCKSLVILKSIKYKINKTNSRHICCKIRKIYSTKMCHLCSDRNNSSSLEDTHTRELPIAKPLQNKLQKIKPHPQNYLTSLARPFTRKARYIEVSPYTPRRVPPTTNANQFIPKTYLITPRIRAVNTCKGPGEIIRNILEGDCEGDLPNTLIDLLHHPSVPHYKDTPLSPIRIQGTPIYMIASP